MGALGFPSGFLRSGVALATFIAWFEKVLIHSMVNIDRGAPSSISLPIEGAPPSSNSLHTILFIFLYV